LRDEHGFTGGITIVRDYVGNKLRSREVFGTLSHKPGHAGRFRRGGRIIDGKLVRVPSFLHGSAASDAPFLQAYPPRWRRGLW
jgi:hypothetical protein